MVSKSGFTLAEVLVTLGIIGIVAAMTIPNLVSNYKKSVTENKLKAQVALISSAIQMAESKHGFTEEWPVCQNTGSVECTANYFDNYLAPELKVLNICKPSVEACWTPPKNLLGKVAYLTNSGTKHISAVLANGSSIYMWAGINSGVSSSEHIQLWFDIDGPNKGRGILGSDVFGIIIRFANSTSGPKGVSIIGADLDSDVLINDASQGCSSTVTGYLAGRYCGALIQANGWKIPKDYPVKF